MTWAGSVWLVERLTDEEFERLSDEAMRLLLAREYTPYSWPCPAADLPRRGVAPRIAR